MRIPTDWLSDVFGVRTDWQSIFERLHLGGIEIDVLPGSNLLQLSITPNRGDCLSGLGLMREIAWTQHWLVPQVPCATLEIHLEALPQVNLKCSDVAYAGRMVRLPQNAATPEYILRDLACCGLRAHGLAVDVTQWIMWRFGQPMHAFDADAIEGSIEVRRAYPEEELCLLDGQNIKLHPDDLVVADEKGALALAGIMGGHRGRVQDNTHNIWLESAFFPPESIAKSLRRHGLNSEASYRFERGVDRALAPVALEQASHILQKAGAQLGEAVFENTQIALPTVTLALAQVNHYLGTHWDPSIIEKLFARLGLDWSRSADHTPAWNLKTPSHRFDLTEAVDWIAEIVRLLSLEHAVKPTLPTFNIQAQMHANPLENAVLFKSLKNHLIHLGYQEAITYSFVHSSQQARMTQQPAVKLKNPMTQDTDELRVHLWPGLLATLAYNQMRQRGQCLRFFELGRCFYGLDPTQQPHCLGGVLNGTAYPEQWGVSTRAVDYFDALGHLSQILGSTLTARPSEHLALREGRSAELLYDGQPVGWLGEISKEVAAAFSIKSSTVVFEVNLDAYRLLAAQNTQIRRRPVHRFPSIRRDWAIFVPLELSYAQLEACLKQHSGKYLEQCLLFDCYEGTGVPEGYRSLAIKCIFQKLDRTMTEEEVEEQWQRMIAAVLDQFKTVIWRKPAVISS